MLIRFKNRLLSLPSKLAMQVMGEEDINAVILIIKRELNSVLEELSAYDPEEIDGQQDDATDEVLDEYEEDEEMDG